MPQGPGALMQGGPGGFLGPTFMTSPGNMPGNMSGMQQNVPPTVPGGTMSGMGVPGMPGNLPTNLGQMQLSGPQGPLLGNFNQLQGPQGGRAEPESRGAPGNMTMPNLGMMPMWPDGQRAEPPRIPMNQQPNMGQACGNLGEGNQIGQQMAILAGGLPPPSGPVMGAFCAQLLGGSMPAQMGGDQLPHPPEKGPDPPSSMEALRQPWMLQELANAAMIRDLDGGPGNLPQAPTGPPGPGPGPRTQLMPEQMPSNQSNQTPLLTLQQQQLILQQLQTSQPGTAALPSQLGFCGMGDLPTPNQTAPPAPTGGPGPATMPQFQNQQLRMQGGMQNFPMNPDYQDVSSQLQQLQDLEDKSRRLYQPSGGAGGATGNFYNASPELGMQRMDDDLQQGLFIDGLRGLAGKGKGPGKADEKLGPCALGGKLGVDRGDELRALSGKGGKKGSKDSRPGLGLTGTGPSGPSGPSGPRDPQKGKSGGKGAPAPGETSFTTSGIGKMRYGNSPNKLFIGNLSLDVTSDDLIEALKPAGEVLGVRLRQGRYSSIAFAEFKHSGCVDIAVRTLQGLVIKGRPARMEFQSGKNDRPEEDNEGREKGKGGKGKGKGGKGNSKGKDAPQGPRQPGPYGKLVLQELQCMSPKLGDDPKKFLRWLLKVVLESELTKAAPAETKVPPGPMAGTLPPRLPTAPAPQES